MLSKVLDVYRVFRDAFSPSNGREGWITLFKFFFPFLVGSLYIGGVYFFFNHEVLYPLIAAHILPPFGRETVIPTGIALGVSPLAMAGLMVLLELIVAAFMVWNYDLVKKIPGLGGVVRSIEYTGRDRLRSFGWANKFAFAAIALLVLIPFQGSGTITASITGRIIGMRAMDVWLAIAVGGGMGNILVAYFADAVIAILGDYVFIAIVILIFAGLAAYISTGRGKKEG
ncbi:small multi-drug export protein [Methanonatronarchaeum sp. AMET6-2]|uniref:small multi-drug export protein n=1 Tax=Methanonatronarchaeum sp. AMET6-2 TaxID=2933293 RepID=UPI001224FFD8|nr:small multi-drug export protein [Methanonatronarchaeum sp. AMET6-2]RZN61285.1 MAG: hypothetical protein EF811_05220 [Methanonatronarchaeia archaeon]UOY09712.1 small multi-drug export protein [Methanonatronarchaeum sp. AMET6-2]